MKPFPDAYLPKFFLLNYLRSLIQIICGLMKACQTSHSLFLVWLHTSSATQYGLQQMAIGNWLAA
jgi:hypothetical protein